MDTNIENFIKVCESDSIVKLVLLKQISRSIAGLNKYNVSMDRTDLNAVEWLTHLQEELMDAVVYIEKLKNLKREIVK
jgi:hypothetical protein